MGTQIISLLLFGITRQTIILIYIVFLLHFSELSNIIAINLDSMFLQVNNCGFVV